ncbi:hypothetical protein [Streptococcus sp. S784/96/1]|uniref:hypothetical protein n=1 Tax=Streptococcus sp. S784/96/1 TaxID=2653499 RepID=UPI001389C6F3|nr:hypothetical protein [Streptococcus sp. S784/96/1]
MFRIEKQKNALDFEIRGFFSINDEQEILGKIYHAIDGIFLELPISNDELDVKLDHLIGINNQDVISLFHLRQCGYSESDITISITKYRVEYMICDSMPYSSLEDINLSKAYFSFEYLSSLVQKFKEEEETFYIHYLGAELK